MEKTEKNNNKKYVCSFLGCSSVFNRPYRLNQHKLSHENIKSFACTEINCNKVYTSNSHLVRHQKSVHSKSENDVIYSCPKCMKTYSNRQNLKRHIKVEHEEKKKPFSCETCQLNFKKKHQLRAHMYIHTGSKTFSCQHCDRDFVSLYEKKKHLRNHKTYRCEHCEAIFNRWTDIISHKKNDHESSDYICNECGKSFKERQHIVKHIKQHSPDALPRIFYCPYDNCQRHYSRNSNLKQHILISHEGKTFDCKHCDAKVVTKAKLNEHIKKIHESEIALKKQKTLENGRKKRKDFNAMKISSAMKLAGVVNDRKTAPSETSNICENEKCDRLKLNITTEIEPINNIDSANKMILSSNETHESKVVSLNELPTIETF